MTRFSIKQREYFTPENRTANHLLDFGYSPLSSQTCHQCNIIIEEIAKVDIEGQYVRPTHLIKCGVSIVQCARQRLVGFWIYVGKKHTAINSKCTLNNVFSVTNSIIGCSILNVILTLIAIPMQQYSGIIFLKWCNHCNLLGDFHPILNNSWQNFIT